MKANTQRLLTWLYFTDEAVPVTASYQQIEQVLPAMSAGGRRSLIHYLTKKLLIRTERIAGQSLISLTSHGQSALEAYFPALDRQRQQWQGEWSVVIFKSGPKGDPHFRYLRQLLLDNHAFNVSRGVYLYPGTLPPQVIDDCQKIYIGAVLILSSQKWIFGDEQTTVNDNYSLLDLVEVYSGISTEINQLLTMKSNQKGLIEKSTQKIYSVFDRFFNILANDPGFLHHYYPHVPTAPQLLQQLHLVLN